MRSIKRLIRSVLRVVGRDLVKYQPDHVLVPRYLCPCAHKLYDFRTELGFAEIAQEIIGHGRISQDYSRLAGSGKHRTR